MKNKLTLLALTALISLATYARRGDGDNGPRGQRRDQAMNAVSDETIATLASGAGVDSFEKWVTSDDAKRAYRMMVIMKAMRTETAVDGNQASFDAAKQQLPQRPDHDRHNDHNDD